MDDPGSMRPPDPGTSLGGDANSWPHSRYHGWVAGMLGIAPPDGNGLALDSDRDYHADHHRAIAARLADLGYPDPSPDTGIHIAPGHSDRHIWEITAVMAFTDRGA